MRTFKSRFSYKLYFGGLLVLLFPIFFGTMGIWILIENTGNGETFKEWGFTILMPTVCISFISASIRHFYKLSPKVVITDKEVFIGDQTIRINDVKLVSVRGKTNDSFLMLPYRYESCSVLLQNGDEYYVAVENYSNGNVIRMNFADLNDFILGKSKLFTPIEDDFNYQSTIEILDTKSAKKYMQTPLKSFNNYIYLGICGGMIWMIFETQDRPIFIMFFFLAMFSMFYFVLIIQNHYFLLTDTHLIVKNLFLPTRQRIFNFDDIDYLETEYLPKQETALKVMTKNFKIYRFQSGLMNDEMFTELIRTVNEKKNKIK